MATVAIARSPSTEGTQVHAHRSDAMATLEKAGTAELLAIVRARSFKTGTFKLSSGKQSNLYFNMKPTMMDSRGAELSARAFLDIAHRLGVGGVSGLEMGAVPVIGAMVAISAVDKRPITATFVRKQPKGHGTNDVIEGLGPDESLSGRTVLVVDDVATSGGSILRAIERIREVGGIVHHAACLVDRQEGGRELLAEHGIELHSVFTAADFLS